MPKVVGKIEKGAVFDSIVDFDDTRETSIPEKNPSVSGDYFVGYDSTGTPFKVNHDNMPGGGGTSDHSSLTNKDLASAGHTFLQGLTNAESGDLDSRLKQTIHLIDFIPSTKHSALIANTLTDDIITWFENAFKTLCTYDNGGGDSDTGTGGTLIFPQGKTLYVDSYFIPIAFATIANSSMKDIVVDGNGCRLKLKDNPSFDGSVQQVFTLLAEELSNVKFKGFIFDGNASVLSSVTSSPPPSGGWPGNAAGIKFWFTVNNPDGVDISKNWFYESHMAPFFMQPVESSPPISGQFLGCRNVTAHKNIIGPLTTVRNQIVEHTYTGTGALTTDHLTPSVKDYGRFSYIKFTVNILTGGVGSGTFEVILDYAAGFNNIEFTASGYTSIKGTAITTGNSIASYTSTPFEFSAANLTVLATDFEDWIDTNTNQTADTGNGRPQIQFDGSATYTTNDSWSFYMLDTRTVNVGTVWGLESGASSTVRAGILGNTGIDISHNISFDGGCVLRTVGCNDVVISHNKAYQPGYASYSGIECLDLTMDSNSTDYTDEYYCEVRAEHLKIVNSTYTGSKSGGIALKTLAGFSSDFAMKSLVVKGNTIESADGTAERDPTSAGILQIRAPLVFQELNANPTPVNWIITGNNFEDDGSAEVNYAFDNIRGASANITNLVYSNNNKGSLADHLETNLRALADIYQPSARATLEGHTDYEGKVAVLSDTTGEDFTSLANSYNDISFLSNPANSYNLGTIARYGDVSFNMYGAGSTENSGTATGGSTTTIQDTSKSWTTDEWAGYPVEITIGGAVGEASYVTSNTANTLTVSPAFTEAVNSNSVYRLASDYGTVTSGASSTLTDTTKSWTTNEWADAYNVEILSGTGAGQTKNIDSNTSDTLTIVGTWTTSPDATSVYQIIPIATAARFFFDISQDAFRIENLKGTDVRLYATTNFQLQLGGTSPGGGTNVLTGTSSGLNVTGTLAVSGNITGNLIGDVTGNVTGNASTATSATKVTVTSSITGTHPILAAAAATNATVYNNSNIQVYFGATPGPYLQTPRLYCTGFKDISGNQWGSASGTSFTFDGNVTFSGSITGIGIADMDDTTATGAELNTLTNGSNIVDDGLHEHHQRIVGKRITSTQSITAATSTTVIFNQSFAADTGLSLNTSTGVITVSNAGDYRVKVQLQFTNSATSQIIYAWVITNGSDANNFLQGSRRVLASDTETISLETEVALSASDTVEVRVYGSNAFSLASGLSLQNFIIERWK